MEEIYNSSPIDQLLEKWRRRKWLLIACFTLLFSVIAAYIFALPSLYRSSTTILFGQDGISEAMVRTSVTSELEQRLGIVTQAVLSREQLQDVIEEFGLYPDLRATLPPESVINRMRKDIGISQRASTTQPQWGQNTTYSITITYQGWDAELVSKVANDLAARFKQENVSIRTGQAARTTAFIREQLELARLKFVAEETRINEYRNLHMDELPEQQAINLATMDRLNSELRLKGEKQVQLLSRRNDLLFGNNESSGAGSTAAGLTGTLRLARLLRDLEEMQLSYTENYPGVIRLQKEIALLELEIAAAPPATERTAALPVRQNPAEIDEELAQLVADENMLRREILELATRIGDAPLIGQQLRSFAYDYDTASEAYVSLQKRYQDALLAESLELQQSQQFMVLEVAIPPDFPSAPGKLGLLFMAFMLAGGVAGGTGLVAEHMDRSFHSVAGLRRFTRVPVLASISAINTTGDKWRKSASFLLGILVVIGAIFLMTVFARQLGQNGEQVVWQLSE